MNNEGRNIGNNELGAHIFGWRELTLYSLPSSLLPKLCRTISWFQYNSSKTWKHHWKTRSFYPLTWELAEIKCTASHSPMTCDVRTGSMGNGQQWWIHSLADLLGHLLPHSTTLGNLTAQLLQASGSFVGAEKSDANFYSLLHQQLDVFSSRANFDPKSCLLLYYLLKMPLLFLGVLKMLHTNSIIISIHELVF